MGASDSMSTNGNGAAAGAEPDAGAATATAQAFVDAIVWGEHRKVWELMGIEGRTEVLEVATKRGMDEGLAARLSGGTASDSERNEFLTDLVNGLRSELAGNDLDNLSYDLDQSATTPGRVTVVMYVPLHPNLGGTLPVGTVELSTEGGEWRVERLIPLTSK